MRLWGNATVMNKVIWIWFDYPNGHIRIEKPDR